MSAKTKILVLHMREVVLGIILAVLSLLVLLFFVVSMNSNKDTTKTPSPITEKETAKDSAVLTAAQGALYVPGIYRTVLYLNEQALNVEVTVDECSITSLSLPELSDSISSMYPLLSPTFDQIREQLYEYQDIQLVTYQPENKYTSLVLLEAISKALEKAALP